MELVDLISETRESVTVAMEAFALYLTVASGYLVVAYIAGKDLSRFQLLFITSLFFAVTILCTVGSYSYFRGAHDMNLHWAPENYDGGYIVYAYWVAVTQILGIAGSLIFMHSSRKK
ncbi:MAG: hypothetical protein RL839_12190 [Gammaproteobacteria bacterium]